MRGKQSTLQILGSSHMIIPGSARPMPGRRFRKFKAAVGRRWPIGKFLKCRSNEVSFCNPSLLFTQPAQYALHRPAAIPHSRRVALRSKTTFHAFSDLQLQSCFPGASQHHSCSAARSRVLSQPVANPHSRSMATNQPTLAQRHQCRLFRLLRGPQLFYHVFS